MEQKDQNKASKPGIPEALDHSIGNGASWESDPHAFLIRSVDPLSQLDEFLIDEASRLSIIDRWNGVEIPDDQKPGTPGSNEGELKTISSEPESTAPKDAPEDSLERDLPAETEGPSIPDESPDLIAEELIQGTKNEKVLKKTKEKAGKRIRKVIKSIHVEHKPELPPVPRKKAEPELSPYTQWLKDLRGSEYVHPYEDDYGLQQMASATKGGVSETFADLLASQGYFKEAREMYQQLMEKYPEKSGFFAAKIEALK
jgi:hypothetical protein